jgi:hypothetical protein
MKYLKYSASYTILLLFVLFTTLTSCKEEIDLQGFDIKKWREDYKGCKNNRLELLAEFDQKVKPKLQGLSEKEVYKLLGKADMNELSRRNQKFYYYFIESGKQCANDTDSSTNTKPARRMQIRFDAINNVNEVVIVYN